MNPPEHLIIKIESLDDVTEEYIESKRKKDPYFTIDEKVFNVTLMSECCGMLEAKNILEELQNKWIEKDNDALDCKRCKDIGTVADVLRDILDFD